MKNVKRIMVLCLMILALAPEVIAEEMLMVTANKTIGRYSPSIKGKRTPYVLSKGYLAYPMEVKKGWYVTGADYFGDYGDGRSVYFQTKDFKKVDVVSVYSILKKGQSLTFAPAYDLMKPGVKGLKNITVRLVKLSIGLYGINGDGCGNIAPKLEKQIKEGEIYALAYSNKDIYVNWSFTSDGNDYNIYENFTDKKSIIDENGKILQTLYLNCGGDEFGGFPVDYDPVAKLLFHSGKVYRLVE